MRRTGRESVNFSAKQIFQLAAGSAVLAGAGTLFYANRIEARRYRLETVSLTIGGEDTADGAQSDGRRTLRILHLSDLHLCHPESDKIEFLEKVTNEEYDLVFLTGDIFENFTGLSYAHSLLTSKPRLGAYAVLGNHDYFNYTMFNKTVGRIYRPFRVPRDRRNVGPMIKALEKGGFHVLRNSSASLGAAGIHIVGIDYPTIDMNKLRELAGEAGDDDLLLVLFHLPVHLDRISAVGAHLAFGGHTHGGQIRLPGVGAIITDSELPRHEASGLFRRGKTIFHISRGLGADPRTNIRLFCPPAATVLEVHDRRRP